MLRANTPLDTFIGTENYMRVRKYLNIHELLANGIQTRIVHDSVCYSFWGDQLVRDYGAAIELVKEIRIRPQEGTAFTYHSCEDLYKKWRPRIARANLDLQLRG